VYVDCTFVLISHKLQIIEYITYDCLTKVLVFKTAQTTTIKLKVATLYYQNAHDMLSNRMILIYAQHICAFNGS